jgi:GTP-binding protein HflX
MDLYEEKTFDEWLETSTKREILNDLEEKWQRETNGNAVFISAIEKRNLDDLRKKILDKVRALYKLRYPYKEVHF